jgi:hypothetical protein
MRRVGSQRADRIAENESLFRAANERVKDYEERRTRMLERYFCECANPECRGMVRLGKADYERVRSNSRRFVIIPGHEVPDVETVIERNEGWAIVEKAPETSPTVEALDPRS